MLLEHRQQLLEVEDRRLPDRADFAGRLEIGGPVEATIGLLDVDDHRVDLGPRDQVEQLVETARRLEDRRGRVERAGDERLHRHVLRHLVVDRDLTKPEAGHLVDQRALLRDPGKHVGTIGIGLDHGLAAIDEDPRSRDRGSVGTGDGPAHDV